MSNELFKLIMKLIGCVMADYFHVFERGLVKFVKVMLYIWRQLRILMLILTWQRFKCDLSFISVGLCYVW